METFTHDNLPVDDTIPLKFRIAVVFNFPFAHFHGYRVCLKWNTKRGKRYPYFVIRLGRIYIQSGWLFG